MKHNRWFLAFALFIVASMILTACGTTATPVTTAGPTSGAAPTSAQGTSTIIIGTTDKMNSLDPADAYAFHDWELLKNINDNLLRWKPGTLTLEPDLATDLGKVSADGLTYTFTLKDGIKFADGTALDATSYAAQLTRMLTVGPGASCPNAVVPSLALPFVDTITAPDAKTIVFKLKVAAPFFNEILATPPYGTADPKIYTTKECTLFPPAPIYGTGPYYISQYTQNESLVFTKNPYYSGDMKPSVDQIVYRFYSDPNTMALAVQNGEIDIAWRAFDIGQINDLKKVSGLTIGTVAGGGIRFLVINHAMAPANDPNVDKALASLIDRNAIVDTVYGGQVTPMWSMLPQGFLGANKAFDTTYSAPNIDAAKKFLEASGYSASKPLELTVYYPPEHYGASTVAAMQLIKTQFEASGEIKVTLTAVDWSTYVTAVVGGKAYAVSILGWFFDYPDSSNYLDPFVYNGGQGTNACLPQSGSAYGVPITNTFQTDATKILGLLNQADVELDQAKRTTEYQDAQQVAADMVLTIPLYYVPEWAVYRSNIHGSTSYDAADALNIGPSLEFWYALLSKTP